MHYYVQFVKKNLRTCLNKKKGKKRRNNEMYTLKCEIKDEWQEPVHPCDVAGVEVDFCQEGRGLADGIF